MRAANSIAGGSPSPLVLAVSPGSRNAAAQQGTAAPGDNATVTLSGDNSSTTAWTASKRKTWTTLTTATGTGSGTVTWTRNATGLAVGTYVDTITVSASGASGSPARVIDTLRITAVPVPLVLAVSPASRNAAAQQGTAAPGDNATVTLSGDNSTTTAWTASKRKSWTTLTTSSGTGSGTVTWTRNATGLAVGTYVDTITVSATGASGSPARVIDTLRITAVPVPLVLAVSPASRNAAAQQGTAAPGDNATVTLSGDNSSTTAWTASKRKTWTTLTTATGTGSGTVTWTRNATGLAVGTYVDTITVSATRRERLTRARHRHAAHHRRAGAAGPRCLARFAQRGGTAGHRRPGRQRHRHAHRRQQHDHGLDGQQAEELDHAHDRESAPAAAPSPGPATPPASRSAPTSIPSP